MVPNVAGGGYDVTARTVAAIAQRSGVVPERIPVFNLDGDGGAVALRRLVAERGNGELAMMMGLGVVGATVTSPGSDPVTAATPIARLIEEPQAVLVPAGSPHRGIGELVAAWRADPAGITIGGGSATGRSGPPDGHAAGRRRPASTRRRCATSRSTAVASCCRRCWTAGSTPRCPAWSSTRPRSAPVSCGCWPCPGRPG